MMQACGYEPAQPAQASNPDVPAIWMVGLVLLAVVVFDVWALLTHRPTISHMTQKFAGKWRWLKAALVIGIALLGFHLIWGF